MSEQTSSHRPLVSGIEIRSFTGTQHSYREVERSGGTLTCLATRYNSDGTETRVLMTCMHVMAGVKENLELRNPVNGAETVMFQGPDLWETGKVGENMDWKPILPPGFMGVNTVDVAVCDLDDGVHAEHWLHSPDPHTHRTIVGTMAPEKGMRVKMLGKASGEVGGTIVLANESRHLSGAFFRGLMKIRWDSFIENGDSGSPVLYEQEVAPGLYRMVGVLFAQQRESRTSMTEDGTVQFTQVQFGWAFPASEAERVMGVVIGKRPGVLLLSSSADFASYNYGPMSALGDSVGDTLDLDSIEVHGASRKWVGGRIPGVAGTTIRRWWEATLTQTSVDVVVRGVSDADTHFVTGRRWGFGVFVKRKGEISWRRVLNGTDELALAGFQSGTGDDAKTIPAASFSVPLNETLRGWWAEYFEQHRSGDFEVKIEGAPVLPAGVEYLGTLPEGNTTVSGSWSSDIASVNRAGRYARFYAFRLGRSGKVKLRLRSSTDPYMFLLAGVGKSGAVLQENDDYDYPDNLNSRITRTLDAGYYTVEATTFWLGDTGDFDLHARLMSDDATLSGLELSAGGLSPAFAAEETAYAASVGHAQNSITVTPTANYQRATITVKGVATASGGASEAISLLVGDNAIDVVVTAEDGTERTYTVTVTRAAYSGRGTTTTTTTTPDPGPDPDPDECTAWVETSNTRGHCDDWEIQETRTCTNSEGDDVQQYRWVNWEGPAETWGAWSSWSSTGRVSGTGREREIERERTRTSNRCRTERETAWVSDPEEPPETWGEWSAWSDTGNTRGTDEYGEKEQSRTRTSSRGRTQTQTRWVTNE